MSLVDTAIRLIDRFGAPATLLRPSSEIDPVTGLSSGSTFSQSISVVPINDQKILAREFGGQGRSIGFYIDSREPVAVGDSLEFDGDMLGVVEVAPTYSKSAVVYYIVRVES